MTHIDFGNGLLLEKYTLTEAMRSAVVADEQGFDTLWVSDHFHPWFHNGGKAAMGWVAVTAIAERTRKISKISTCVTCPILRYNPAIVAQTFATLGVLYPGRIALGVGAGEAMNEVPVTGKWPSPSERLDMLTEAIRVIRTLWETDDFCSFKGRYFTLKNAMLYTKPEKKIPIYFAAAGPKACELAGRHGDHLIMAGGRGVDYVRNVGIPAFEKGAAAAGKDPEEMKVVLSIALSLNDDYGKALESCKRMGAWVVPAMYKYDIHDPREIEAHARLVSEKYLTDTYIVTSSADEVIERLDAFVKIGIADFALLNLSPDLEASVRTMGEKVIPYFRETYEE